MIKFDKRQSIPALLVGLEMIVSGMTQLLIATPTFAQSRFSDVQTSWAQSCIVQLSNAGIISGYPDGTFRPTAPVTRAEFAAMVGKAFPNASRTRNAVQFSDVPSSFWAYNAVETAAQTGFLSGYPGAIFKPSQNIPRAQALIAIASGLNYSPVQPVTTTLNNNFTDASAIPTYAANGIAAATEKGLVVDYPDVKSLQPNQLATRADISAFLCQALTSPGQVSAIPAQYIAGNNVSSQVAALLSSGTSIPVKYPGAKKIAISPKETVPLTLTVASDVSNSQGTVIIPAGSQIAGQLQPVKGGSQFVASQVTINGSQYPLNASSNQIKTIQNLRSPNTGSILKDAVLGSGAAAGLAAITGNDNITAGKVLTGTLVGTAVGANANRNLGSTALDTILGAAAGVGVAGLTGDQHISTGKVVAGAAAGATLGGLLDHSPTSQVVVINPNSDLNLTLNSDFNK